MGVPFSESAFCIQRKALESQGKVWACLEFGLHLCYWAGSVSHYKNAKYLSKCGFPCQGAIPKKPRGSEVGLATPCLLHHFSCVFAVPFAVIFEGHFLAALSRAQRVCLRVPLVSTLEGYALVAVLGSPPPGSHPGSGARQDHVPGRRPQDGACVG